MMNKYVQDILLVASHNAIQYSFSVIGNDSIGQKKTKYGKSTDRHHEQYKHMLGL